MLSYRNGSEFNIPGETMQRLGLPTQVFANLTGDFLEEFVFVTAASANHYKESIDAIATVQKYFPGRKIYYYDLGLKSAQRKEVGGENIYSENHENVVQKIIQKNYVKESALSIIRSHTLLSLPFCTQREPRSVILRYT